MRPGRPGARAVEKAKAGDEGIALGRFGHIGAIFAGDQPSGHPAAIILFLPCSQEHLTIFHDANLIETRTYKRSFTENSAFEYGKERGRRSTVDRRDEIEAARPVVGETMTGTLRWDPRNKLRQDHQKST